LDVLQYGDCRPQSIRGLVKQGLLVNGRGDYRLARPALERAHWLWLSGRFACDELVSALQERLYDESGTLRAQRITYRHIVSRGRQ
jgi:hypothetical protein